MIYRDRRGSPLCDRRNQAGSDAVRCVLSSFAFSVWSIFRAWSEQLSSSHSATSIAGQQHTREVRHPCAIAVLIDNLNLVVSLLYFFDTGGGHLPEIVDNSQVAWYRNLSASLNAKSTRPLPSLAFFHIPLEDYISSYKSSNKVHPYPLTCLTSEASSSIIRYALGRTMMASRQ